MEYDCYNKTCALHHCLNINSSSGFGARNSVSAEGENKVFMQGQHIGRRNLHYRNNKGGCGKL